MNKKPIKVKVPMFHETSNAIYELVLTATLTPPDPLDHHPDWFPYVEIESIKVVSVTTEREQRKPTKQEEEEVAGEYETLIETNDEYRDRVESKLFKLL